MTPTSIVVVESDPITRDRITRELKDLGYNVGNLQSASVPVAAPIALGQDAISAGGITIDILGHRVIVDGHFVSVAPREYQLLMFLLKNQDRVFSREHLLVHSWDRDTADGPCTVDVSIRRLRSVLEQYNYDGYLQTVRGAGYRFSLKT